MERTCKECSEKLFFVELNENYTTLTCSHCFTPVTLFGNVEVGE